MNGEKIRKKHWDSRNICEKLIENGFEGLKGEEVEHWKHGKGFSYLTRDLGKILKKSVNYNPHNHSWLEAVNEKEHNVNGKFQFIKERSSNPIKNSALWDISKRIYLKLKRTFAISGYWPEKSSIKNFWSHIEIYPEAIKEAYGETEDEKIVAGYLYSIWEQKEDMGAKADQLDEEGFDLSEEFIGNIHDRLREAKGRSKCINYSKNLLSPTEESENNELIKEYKDKIGWNDIVEEKVGTTTVPEKYFFDEYKEEELMGILFKTSYCKSSREAEYALKKLSSTYPEYNFKECTVNRSKTDMLEKRSLEKVPIMAFRYRDIFLYFHGAEDSIREFVKYSGTIDSVTSEGGYQKIKRIIELTDDKKVRIDEGPFTINFFAEVITDEQ